MHKTSVTDWLTYVQSIMQPSFVGPSTSSAPGIYLQCLCRNLALWELSSNILWPSTYLLSVPSCYSSFGQKKLLLLWP